MFELYIFHRLRSTAVLLGIALTGVTVSGSVLLAQELSVEIPGSGSGQSTDLSTQKVAPAELPKASGFEELTAPKKAVLPFIEDESDIIVVPPAAKLVEPEPKKPVAKTEPADPPKAAAKPKLAIPLPRAKPPVVAKKPKLKLPVAEKPKQTPVVAKKPKAKLPVAEEPKQKPVVAKKPKLQPVVTQEPKLEKVTKTDPAEIIEIPFVGIETTPKTDQPEVMTIPAEPTPLVEFKVGPVIQSSEVTSGPIAPVSTAAAEETSKTQPLQNSKSDRIDRN